MTDLNRRIEQSILEYQSRLNHIDEMLQHAKSGLGGESEHAGVKSTLVELQQERDRLGTLYEQLRLKSVDNWLEEEIEISGPMAIWDVVAQKLENLLERIKK